MPTLEVVVRAHGLVVDTPSSWWPYVAHDPCAVDILQKWCQCFCGGFSLQSSEDGCDVLCSDEAECHILAEILEGAVVCGVYCLEAALLYMLPYGLCEVEGTALQFHIWEDDACCVPRGIFKIKHDALDRATGKHGTQLTKDSYVVGFSTSRHHAHYQWQLFRAAFVPNKSVNRKQLVERLSHDVERGVDVPSLGV